MKILKLHRLSPFLSFTVKDSPLKMWLKQQDVDSAYELIQNDTFVNEFIEDLNREVKNEDYVTQLLIDWFKLFSEGYKKWSKIADQIINLFGGNVMSSRKGINPILDAWSVGRFECVQYVIERRLVSRWDLLVDKLGKNIIHYACEHNDYVIVKNIVKNINNNLNSNTILNSLLMKRWCVNGFIPRHYSDPHRAIWKYITR